MFEWSSVLPLILNTLAISIPEVAFLVMFSLIFMRRFDLLEINKVNTVRFFSIIIPFALITNILREYAGFNGNNTFVISILGLFLLIAAINRIRSISGLLKTFLAVSISHLVALIVQTSYIAFILYGTSVTLESLNQFGLPAIILSLVDRVVQICIIGLLLLKKRSFMKLNFFRVITRNKSMAGLAAVITIFNIFFVYIMANMVFAEKILISMKPATQILVIFAIVAFPIMNISAIFGVINYSVNKYTHTRLYIQEESRVLRALVQVLLKQRKYDEIDKELLSFEKEARKIV